MTELTDCQIANTKWLTTVYVHLHSVQAFMDCSRTTNRQTPQTNICRASCSTFAIVYLNENRTLQDLGSKGVIFPIPSFTLKTYSSQEVA